MYAAYRKSHFNLLRLQRKKLKMQHHLGLDVEGGIEMSNAEKRKNEVLELNDSCSVLSIGCKLGLAEVPQWVVLHCQIEPLQKMV